jgi:ferredoxin
VLAIRSGAENVPPPTKDEMDTIDMCTDVQGARLGCQLLIQGDIAILPLG